MNAIVIALRCNWCSRQQSPRDLMQITPGQLMCRHCYEWHAHALGILSGDTPRGCQACGLTMAHLNGLSVGATTRMYGAKASCPPVAALRMYVVPKDGIYAVLCALCKDEYCGKRADLYKGTQFGQELNL